MTIYQIYDAAGRKIGGDYSSRALAMRAIPPSEHGRYKAIPVEVESVFVDRETAYGQTIAYARSVRVF